MDRTREFRLRQLGAKVAYYRKLRCMTQGQLAAKISVNRNTIGRIERGKYNKNVSLSMLMDIADGMGIELVSLLDFSEADAMLERDSDSHMLAEAEKKR